MSLQLLAPTTSGATGSFFDCAGPHLPITIVAEGLAAAEEVTFEISADNGVSWGPIGTADSDKLIASSVVKVFSAPGKYRPVKTATVGSVGVEAIRVGDV